MSNKKQFMRLQVRYHLFLKRIKETNKDNFDFKTNFKPSKLELVMFIYILLSVIYKIQDKKNQRIPANLPSKEFYKNYYDYVDPNY